LCLLLIGTCSSVFAVDFSQTLDLAKQDIFSMWDLFKWKSTVSNLYGKALKLAKDKEVSSTTASFDQLAAYFSECSRVTNQDFINILYHTNFSFKNTFDLILPKWTQAPSKKDIDTSYSKFFTCRKILVPTSVDIQNITNEITAVYYAWYTTSYATSTLNEDNYWSDFFWNGTLDDSDFDILYDINQVGKTLFENFKESPQILFYRMPAKVGASPIIPQAGGALSSLTDQSSYQVWGGGWSFPGTTWAPLWTSISQWWWTTTTTTTSVSQSQSVITSLSVPSVTDDSEVQNFIENTNATAPAIPAGVALVFWNQCLSWDTATPPVEAPPVLMTPEEYISGIVTFIENASLDDVITTNLLTQFHKDNPLPVWRSTSNSGYANGVANAYAEQAFGTPASGSCESACTSLPLDKQAQCELSCSKSCIQKCDGLWIQDKALCISDCVCFLVSGPNGQWWEGVEDMYRIKFCKVPVQSRAISPWKTVYSIQAIFQEISDVLAWLRDSGQMVKFSKTKEFLDSNIKIKFADNFAFKLQVWFKPLFEQRSAIIKKQEQEQANTDMDLAVLGMNAAAPEADDYDKYIVIADPIRNKANLEQATSLVDINKNIENVQAAALAAVAATKLSNESLDAVVSAYSQQTSILFIQNMISFLKDNQSFWDNLSLALLDMNKMTLELKSKIENSK